MAATGGGQILTENSYSLDIAWLAQRLATLYPEIKALSKQEVKALQTRLSRQTGGSRRADPGEEVRAVLQALLDTMGLDAPVWVEAPGQNELPVLAILPNVGCRIIYSRTPEGSWLMEGPSGSQQLGILPDGASYVLLSAARRGMSSSTTAFALFKEVLLAHKSLFFQAGTASLVANLLALGASLYSMQVYDRVIPTRGNSTLIVLTIGVLIANILEILVKLARSTALDHSIQGIDLELSHKIFHRLLSIRMDQFPRSVGTLSAQLRSYEMIRSFMSSASFFVAIDAPFALFFLGVILAMGGPFVAMVPLIFFVISLSVGLLYRWQIAHHAESGANVANHKLGTLVETIEGAETVKASGAGWQQLLRWNELSRRSVHDDLRIRRFNEQATYTAAFLQQVSYVALIFTGAWIATTTKDLTTGGIVGCSILSGRVLGPVAMLPGLIVQWAHARAALSSLEKVFALESDNHGVERPLSPESLGGEYQVSDLKFTYPGRPETISINRLHIGHGEKVAIIGPIGAGKSTFLKLLAGLYKPIQGRVLLDGLDIQQISRTHLSEHVGYCPQEVKLLSGTLRDNLTMGLAGINDDQILRISQLTGLSGLIAGHPKGLDLEIMEGGNGVSGGQKQLISITRLIITNPNVWLLDEPTASMDDMSEQNTMNALRQQIKSEHTVIIVTHKASMLGLVERLIVLTPNGIVLDGPRSQVLEKLQQNAKETSAPQGQKIFHGRRAQDAVSQYPQGQNPADEPASGERRARDA